MSEKKVVATMMPKQKAPTKKKATAKKKAVAKKKAAPKKKAVVKKKAVKKPTVKKVAEQLELPLPEVEMPGEFQRVEHPPMGVKDQDAEAAMFLIVVSVIAAIVLAMAFGA
jgi:hypothetical protein